jgi:hypothetical protein
MVGMEQLLVRKNGKAPYVCVCASICMCVCAVENGKKWETSRINRDLLIQFEIKCIIF